MSGEPIGFYFDFISPYGYLGSVAIEKLAAKYRREVEWRPVLLGVTVLKIMGMKPLPETPLKGPYLARDIVRTAGFLDIPYAAQPATISALPVMRAFVRLNERDSALAKKFGQEVYRTRCVEAEDPSTPKGLTKIARTLGLDATELIGANDDPAIKTRLVERVNQAVAAGVFGVPTFETGGELFWGTDHLPQLERWLTTGGW